MVTSEKTYHFRGTPYKIACIETFPQHPSWFTFEDETSIRDQMWTIGQNDCVIDVGAAYGSYSLTALSQGAAQCFAWSPQGTPNELSERDLFLLSLAANGWEGKCKVYGGGLYDQDGYLDTLTQGFSVDPPTTPNDGVIAVQRVDTWYEQEFKPNFSSDRFSRVWLKLDVEGAEVEVLKSASGLISELRPNIMVENHNFKRPTLEQEVRALVTSFGYTEVATVPYHSVSHSLYLPEV